MSLFPGLNWTARGFSAVPLGYGWPATFSRAASGLYVKSSGLVAQAASGALRHTHSEAGEYLGALIEEARTNYLLRSSRLDNASWVKLGTATATQGAGAGPDGTTNYTDIVVGTGSGTNSVYQLISSGLTNSSRYEPSFWINPVSTSGSLRVEDSFTGSANGRWTIDMSLLTAGVWQRVTRYHAAVTINNEFTANGSGQGGLVFYAVSGTISAAVALVNAQVGSFPTSEIETTSATATRPADALSALLSSLPGGFNTAEGTLLVEIGSLINATAAANGRIAQINDGSGANRILLIRNSGAQTANLTVTAGGVEQASINTAALTAPLRIAASWKANNINVTANGVSATADTANSIPAGLTTLLIGGDSSYLNGSMLALQYIPRWLTDAERENLTR